LPVDAERKRKKARSDAGLLGFYSPGNKVLIKRHI